MVEIKTEIVKKLIESQFSHWAHLAIKPVKKSGHDNRTYHLGDEMTIRLPSDRNYVAQIEKELKFLPRLKPFLSLPISEPVAKGQPSDYYPFPWSINRYIAGDTASYKKITRLNQFATDLALFLKELQQIDTFDAPVAGKHNFYRGGNLAIYNLETIEALKRLKDELPVKQLNTIWECSLNSEWEKANVWIHGDIAPNNLLVKDGKLCGVIDFGIMGVGDPACDYAIAWTFFDEESRHIFFETSELDKDTIYRAKGWALWKALITYHSDDKDMAVNANYTINSILAD